MDNKLSNTDKTDSTEFLKSILTFLFFFIACNSFSQEQQNEYHLYFDENGKNIDSYNYLKKCTSFLYNCKKIKKDSIYINSINEFFKFGKLTESELFQLKHLLKRDTKSKDLDNKTIIISFRDTLFGYAPLKKRMDSLTIAHKHDHKMSESKYNSGRRSFDKSRKKCHKKYQKENIKPLYFYRHSYGYNYFNKNFKWHKLSKSLNALFFDNQHSSMVILKPDGNFFYYHNIRDVFVNKLLKNNWEPFIKDYNIAKTNLLKERNGFFKDLYRPYENPLQFYTVRGNRKTTYKYFTNNNPYGNPYSSIKVNNRRNIQQYLNNLKTDNCFSYGSY